MRFERDPNEDVANQQKHAPSFSEATELLASNNDYLEIYGRAHSDEEDRFIAIGVIRAGIDVIRIVSARKAKEKEAGLFYRYDRRQL